MFVLGTVQMGLQYGIANTYGKPGVEEASRMVRYARECGINYVDTAQVYGDSETVLGEVLGETRGLPQVNVISKISPCLHDAGDAA